MPRLPALLNSTSYAPKHHTSLRLVGAAVALELLGACAATPTQEAAGEYVDDTVITAKVKAAILGEPTLTAAEIVVETFKGRVQLSGFVSSSRKWRQL